MCQKNIFLKLSAVWIFELIDRTYIDLKKGAQTFYSVNKKSYFFMPNTIRLSHVEFKSVCDWTFLKKKYY